MAHGGWTPGRLTRPSHSRWPDAAGQVSDQGGAGGGDAGPAAQGDGFTAAEGAPVAAPTAAPAEQPGEPQQAPGQVEPTQRSIIYTGAMSVRVDNVQDAANRAADIAAGLGGLVGARPADTGR